MFYLFADDHASVKMVMVQNSTYSEPLYDKVGGPPQIAIPLVPPSASDTQSINSSPLIGTPEPEEPYTMMMSQAPSSPSTPKSPKSLMHACMRKEKGSQA